MKKKLYIAGPISGWRKKVYERLKDIFDVYDPVQHSRQGCQAEYAPDDFKAAKKADIILAYQPKDKEACLAMGVEATLGYCSNKAIVIYVDERGYLDPIMIAISKRTFSELEPALKFLERIAKE